MVQFETPDLLIYRYTVLKREYTLKVHKVLGLNLSKTMWYLADGHKCCLEIFKDTLN